jgi:hypothetical protein
LEQVETDHDGELVGALQQHARQDEVAVDGHKV